MSVFEDFEREFGPPEDCIQPDEETISSYREKLPQTLLEMWREQGWCSWGNGLIWITNPAQLSDVLEEWADLAGMASLVFLRTSFGHLYFWRDGWVFSLDVHHGSLSQVTQDMALMFTLFCNPAMKMRILQVDLHNETVQRLGRPSRDECFTYEPALALGGTGGSETIRKVKIREQLGILAQVAGEG